MKSFPKIKFLSASYPETVLTEYLTGCHYFLCSKEDVPDIVVMEPPFGRFKCETSELYSDYLPFIKRCRAGQAKLFIMYTTAGDETNIYEAEIAETYVRGISGTRQLIRDYIDNWVKGACLSSEYAPMEPRLLLLNL